MCKVDEDRLDSGSIFSCGGALCVATFDPYCATGRWDSYCATEVEHLGCGLCR